jgi:glycine cleavage system aminomethyltransferase T
MSDTAFTDSTSPYEESLATVAPGSELVVDVRGKPRRARIVKKPIYRKES